MECYWLLELEIDGPACYYTAPRTWGCAVDLATKFHTQVAAEAEAAFLQIPAAYRVVARSHMWSAY